MKEAGGTRTLWSMDLDPAPDAIGERGAPGELTVAWSTAWTWYARLFLTVWLVGWITFGFLVSSWLLRGLPGVLRPIVIVVWAGAALGFGSLCLWNWLGREVLRVHGPSLAVQKRVLGFGPTRRFDLARIRNLRVDVQPTARPLIFTAQGADYSMFRVWNWVGGSVAFEYADHTQRFGINLGEAEAQGIVARLARAVPVLAAATVPSLAVERPRAHVSEGPNGLLILIPPARDANLTRFALALLVICFTFAGLMPFIVRWSVLVVVLYEAVVARITWIVLHGLAWNLWRRETVRLDASSAVLERRLGSWSRTEHLALLPESRLRLDIEPVIYRSGGAGRGRVGADLGMDTGPLLLEVSPALVRRFGFGLSANEAAAIIDRIHAKFPSLGPGQQGPLA